MDILTDTLLCHLSYEEQNVVEPLAAMTSTQARSSAPPLARLLASLAGYAEGGLMLSVLDATPDGDRVYRQLVAIASAELPLVANATGLDVNRTRTAPVALVGRGLAEEADGRYRAAPPEVAERLIHERMQQVRAAQAAAAELHVP